MTGYQLSDQAKQALKALDGIQQTVADLIAKGLIHPIPIAPNTYTLTELGIAYFESQQNPVRH